MSEADQLYNPGKHPKVHPDIMKPFVRANVAYPQMYGGMILRAGRVAYDLMVAGKVSPGTFSRSLPDSKQITDMAHRAVASHEHAGITIPYAPNGGRKENDAGILTPIAMRGVYIRARRGILKAIHSYAITALELPLDAPDDPAVERVFMTKRLLHSSNRPAALLLQKMWQTADDAAHGRPVAEVTAMLHRTFSDLSENENERAADTAVATRAARTVFDGLITPALAELKPEAENILGSIKAEDAIDLFPFDVIHEGADEFTDAYIQHVRANGRTADGLYYVDD